MRTAYLAGELGVLAVKRGYATWSSGEGDDGLAHHMRAALADLHAAAASLT